ncbi:MAG: hypothetical protein AB1600_03305 [Bacteroidota bacterium]
MKWIRVKWQQDGRFLIIESDHKSFTTGRIVALGQLRLAAKQGYTVTILPE